MDKRLMKSILTFVTLLFMACNAFAEGKQYESTYDRVIDTKTLRCGYFVWAPHFVIDPLTGEKSGFVYDMIEELGKTLGLKIEWAYEYNLGEQLESFKANKIDALCADGNFTKSALPYLDYTDGYLYIVGYAYALKDNKKITDFESLNSPDITFSVIDGDGSEPYIHMFFPKAKLLSMPVTTDSSMVGQNVFTRKADVMLNDPMSVDNYQKEDKEKLRLIGSNHPLAISPIHISLPKGQERLLTMLNQGIGLMNDVGIIDKVLDKYDPTGKKILRPQKRYR